jgi:hypothetical protein
MRNYLVSVPDATKQEVATLQAWVEKGYSPYSNPSHIADEQGRELPFIQAPRAEQELGEDGRTDSHE